MSSFLGSKELKPLKSVSLTNKVLGQWTLQGLNLQLLAYEAIFLPIEIKVQ